MRSQASTQGLSLHDAARAMGVRFANDNVPQDKFVDANGLRFHYLEWGNPDNPPMLLLHGFAQTCHSWDFVALGFSDDYHVIVLDQRGHGDSDWAPDGDYSPETQQQDISAVVDALGLEGFVLMGLSMGGRNSFTYAANNPGKVKALVIVDAAPQNMTQGTDNIRNFVQQDDELESVDAFVDRVLQFNPRRDRQQVRGSILHNLKELPNGNWTWKYDRALRRPGRRMGSDPDTEQRLWGYIRSLQCPTLLVRGGASDIVALDTADRMHQAIPNSRLATIEGAGHLVMGDSPSGFQNAVTEFIASL
ncbi:MAG: alpha/beta hydrolase [Chloroflexi bacterium]|nr:alpha/beta hydrolase [Chloroflexota bacterium]MYC05820.1 alpha/beta hydrolase [Chloroflexota bacterium]